MKKMIYIVIKGMKVYGEIDTEKQTIRLATGKEYTVDDDGKARVGFNKYTVYNALNDEEMQ